MIIVTGPEALRACGVVFTGVSMTRSKGDPPDGYKARTASSSTSKSGSSALP
jgi:hypothetical protein